MWSCRHPLLHQCLAVLAAFAGLVLA
jgi:hypothetical protein